MTQSIVFPALDDRVKICQDLLVVPQKVSLSPNLFLPQVIDKNRRVALEYCSGNGEWILSKASSMKEVQWIGVEMRYDRMKKIWKKKHDQKLDNLYLIFGEAYLSTKHFIKECSIDEIYINFPDPWPKRRHAKNRLIQPRFLEELFRILKPMGKIIFVTDDKEYADETASCFNQDTRFIQSDSTCENYGSSFFHRLWLEKGKTIYYLTFEKTPMHFIIDLSCGMDSLLNWTQEKKFQEEKDSILWNLDFNIQKALDDEGQFAALQLALDHFKKDIYDHFATKTKGAILHRGKLPLYEKNKAEWLSDRSFKESTFHDYLHSRDVFLDFLKLLMIALPPDVDSYLCLDLSNLSLKELLQFISYEPLWDFKLAIKGVYPVSDYSWSLNEVFFSSSYNATNALLIPSNADEVIFEKLANFMQNSAIGPMRICFEDRLNSQWDGIENLFVDPSILTAIGKRMLQGFISAQGNITTIKL